MGAYSRAYRLGFSKHSGAELDRQFSRCQQINVHTQQGFQLVLQAPKIEQSHPRQCVYQYVQVTGIPIRAVQYRDEYAQIRRTVATCGFTYSD